MMHKILLGKNKSKISMNVDNHINVELSTDSQLLPVSDVDEKINSYEEYVNEKDSSDIYRMIFTINPICSNVLFNAYSEIVYKEGSDECIVIKKNGMDISGNTPTELKNYHDYTGRVSYKKDDFIRDTGYSSKSIGPFVYHCGADIFNNHLLRKKEFLFVNKTTSKDGKFNTINDFLRDSEGNIIKEKILKPYGLSRQLSNTDVNMHLYRRDSINSYKRTVALNLSEENGWFGFRNVSTMNIENYNYDTINKCMNNNKPNEFIDMYPDRSLYSFIPKYNKYRNRMENNWDYCITYPYTSYTDNTLVSYRKLNVDVCNGIHCTALGENNLKGTILDKNSGYTVENLTIYFKTQIKNTFNVGDFINITVFNGNIYETSLNPIKITILGYAGEDTSHIFGINLMDFYYVISLTGEKFIDDDGHLLKNFEIRARKYEKGIDCKYYIRKFRKMPNFKGSNVYLDKKITESEIKENIKPFNSSLNRLAYGENIYSDKMVQIVFNDDIVTNGIKDNLGRDLSELYLTIIKRNAGYKKWYNDKQYRDENVEFSHCFGRIDAGFDLSIDENDYNIHKISYYENVSARLNNDEITIDNEVFDGDIVEFSPYTLNERVLENVYFRFNTAQRECIESEFGEGITYDEILSDDYDINEDFKVATNILNNNKTIHLNPEGYYYKPHYRVCINEFKENINQGNHTRVIFSSDVHKIYKNEYSATTSVNYFFNNGDEIFFYEKFTHNKKIGHITGISGVSFNNISFNITGINKEEFGNYIIYKPNPLKPEYSYDLEDGTGRYLWREKKSDKDMTVGDELYNSIFTNGAHYRHQNINFFLRRQDPTGEYGLSSKCKLDKFVGVEGKIKDITQAEYISEGGGTLC